MGQGGLLAWGDAAEEARATSQPGLKITVIGEWVEGHQVGYERGCHCHPMERNHCTGKVQQVPRAPREIGVKGQKEQATIDSDTQDGGVEQCDKVKQGRG